MMLAVGLANTFGLMFLAVITFANKKQDRFFGVILKRGGITAIQLSSNVLIRNEELDSHSLRMKGLDGIIRWLVRLFHFCL